MISKKEVIHKIQNTYTEKLKNKQNCVVLVQKAQQALQTEREAQKSIRKQKSKAGKEAQQK